MNCRGLGRALERTRARQRAPRLAAARGELGSARRSKQRSTGWSTRAMAWLGAHAPLRPQGAPAQDVKFRYSTSIPRNGHGVNSIFCLFSALLDGLLAMSE